MVIVALICRNVVRWGKNIETGQRRATRRAGAAVYSSASSLETLIGYLYLTNQQRLEELMAKLGFSNDNSSLLAGFGLPQIDTSIRPSL
jgi:ribonuclease-3 family protein